MRIVEEGVVGVVVRRGCDDKDDDDSDDVWRCVERRVEVCGMWRRWAFEEEGVEGAPRAWVAEAKMNDIGD